MDRWPIFLLCWICCLPQVGSGATDTSGDWHALLAADATLHDVVFVDAEHGWAVGNQGAIWHTTDGGQNWQRQTAPTSVDLGGVWFVDRDLGCAVGGRTSPYLWTSQASVLRTSDGGKSWQPQLALLPALIRVKFFDSERGVAWGRGSGGEPLGVFASDDSGGNWRTVSVGWPAAWWGGDFANQHTGAVVGAGQAARITNGDAAKLDLGERDIRAVQIASEGNAWAVGDRGAILRSRDGGMSWSAVDVLPDDLRAVIDWYTVAMHGQHVWIAGSPGTVVLHSPDGGETWQGHATGSHVPLRKMTFIDDLHGWAVGDLGTILHTSDGGQTWQVQRRGGERAAVLVVCTDEKQLPFETLAKLSVDGYRTVVCLLRPNDANDPTHHARLAEALASVGCLFSPPPRSLHQNHGGERSFGSEDARLTGTNKYSESLVEHLACQLRIWRPAVLVVPGNEKQFEQAAELAVKQASDVAQLPHLSEQLALPAWEINRLFLQLPPGSRGTHRVKSAEIVSPLSTTLGEIATAARSLLHRDFQSPPETNEFLLKASYVGEPTASITDLAAGLSIAPGSDGRRPALAHQSPFDPQTLRRLVEKRRNVANIFRFAEGNPALLAQVGQMMGDLSEGAAAALLYELAAQFEQVGEMQLAVDTRELLVRRSANDPLVAPTLVWLVQFYASGETAHAYRQIVTESTLAGSGHRGAAVVGDSGDANVHGVLPATALVETEYTKGQSQTSKAPSPEYGGGGFETLSQRRYARAVQLAEHVAQTRPLLNAEPQLRVPAAIAERKRGTSERAERYLQSLALRYPGEAWQECGAVERWLAEPDKPLPHKPRVTCRFTDERPKLDGKLTESFWNNGTTLKASLQSAIAYPKSEILLSHDEQYLYLAVRCAKAPDTAYSAETGARTYDADLSKQDRVGILLDLDRDWTTYFALTVDHRGWTNDACWHDRTWNPKWFVAAGGDAESWTVEAAIPWAELTDTPPKIGDAWAVACERIILEVGAQVLTGDGVSEVGPQDFGVLVFK